MNDIIRKNDADAAYIPIRSSLIVSDAAFIICFMLRTDITRDFFIAPFLLLCPHNAKAHFCCLYSFLDFLILSFAVKF